MYIFKVSHPTRSVPKSRPRYRQLLDWTTHLFGSLRVFTYIPTIMTLIASADSSQHNLLTWTCWVMANASLTANLYESTGRKATTLVLVNAGNTVMCMTTMAVIYYLRP